MLHIVSLVFKKRSVCSYTDYILSSITYFSNYLTLEFEESCFFRVMAVVFSRVSLYPISLVLHRPLPAVSRQSFRFRWLNHTISIDRNLRTSSSDIYSIPFSLSLSSPSFLLPPLFPRNFFLHLFSSLIAARDRLCILSISFSLFLSLPPLLLSFLYVHVWRCDYDDGRERTGVVRSLRPVWLHRSAWGEPYRTEGTIFLCIVRAIWGAVLIHRFTPVPGPANGSSPGPIGRPIGVHRFPVPRLSKCHPSVPTCNRLHHSWKIPTTGPRQPQIPPLR